MGNMAQNGETNQLSPEERERILRVFRQQTNLANRIWYYLHYASFLSSINIDVLSNEMKEEMEDDSINPEIRNSIRKTEVEMRKMLGLPSKRLNSPEMESLSEDTMLGELEREIVGDGTQEAKNASFDTMASLDVRIKLEIGKEYRKYLQTIPPVEEDPENPMTPEKREHAEMVRRKKAMYITSRSMTRYNHFSSALGQLYTRLQMGDVANAGGGEDYAALNEEDLINFRNRTKDLVVKELPPSERELYDLGEAISNGINADGDPELSKWMMNEGPHIALQYSRNSMRENYSYFRGEISQTKPFMVNSDPEMRAINTFRAKERDADFLRGVIADLESTGTGEKKSWEIGWHKTNSPEYEKLMKLLKLYEYRVSSADHGKAEDVRVHLVKACKAYLRGREKVRRHPFGRKRVNDVLLIMSDIMLPSDFRAEVQRINIIRKAGIGDDDYIMAENYTPEVKRRKGSEYHRLRLAALEASEEKQKKTQENSTEIPDFYKKQLENLENIYGREPRYDASSMQGVFSPDPERPDRIREFPGIRKEYSSIGPTRIPYGIADKDFTAIAFAGALTREALEEGMKGSYGTVYDPDITGPEYSEKAAVKTFGKDIAKYKGVIQFGRTSAEQALKEYSEGNKEPLAKLLAAGIKYCRNYVRNSDKLDNAYILYHEMASRMLNMMDRDPELERIALENDLTRGMKARMKDLEAGAKVVKEAAKGVEKLLSVKKTHVPLTEEEKLGAATDIVMKRILSESCRRTAKLEHGYNRLLESITDPKEYESLRSSVREFTAKNELHRLPPSDILKKTSEPEFFRKVALLTKEKQEKANVRAEAGAARQKQVHAL